MAGSVNCYVFFCLSVWGVSFKKNTIVLHAFWRFLSFGTVWPFSTLAKHCGQPKIVCAKQELMQQNPYRFARFWQRAPRETAVFLAEINKITSISSTLQLLVEVSCVSVEKRGLIRIPRISGESGIAAGAKPLSFFLGPVIQSTKPRSATSWQISWEIQWILVAPVWNHWNWKNYAESPATSLDQNPYRFSNGWYNHWPPQERYFFINFVNIPVTPLENCIISKILSESGKATRTKPLIVSRAANTIR